MDLKTYLSKPGNTQARLGASLNPPVTQGAISQWLADRVPAERVLQVEAATGGEVTRYEMRSDIYPLPDKAA